jgi:tetratricopeptide (TPR) repeat protein
MCFNKALDMARVRNDKYSQAGYLTNIGALAVRLDDQDKIIEAFEKVRKLTRETGDVPGEMNALNQLIRAYTALERHEFALIYTQDARKLASENDFDQGNPYTKTLVAQLFGLERDEEAFTVLRESIESARQRADTLREFELLTNLGGALYERDQLEEAYESWTMALKLAGELDKAVEKARIMGYLAMVSAEKGDLKESIEWSHESLELAESCEDRRIVGEQLVSLSLAYRDLGDMKKAMDYCQKGREAFAQVGLYALQEKTEQLYEELKAA